MDEETALQTPLLEPSVEETNYIVDNVGVNEPHDPAKNTLGHTVLLFIGIYVGLGLLSQAYALAIGGWFALGLLAFSCCLFAASATLVSTAMTHLGPGDHKSYTGLGAASLGLQYGKPLVAALATLELFGGASITLLVIWSQLELILPAVSSAVDPMQAAILVSTVFLIPLIALPDLKRLSRVSMLGGLSSVLVISAVVALPLCIDPDRSKMPHQPPASHDTILWPGALKSIGVAAVSISGHSAIPSLRLSMRQPSQFPLAIFISFSIMAVLYGVTAAAGYAYFGSASSPLITTDLAINSPYAHGLSALPWLHIDKTLAFLVVCNCMAKFPALIMVLQDVVLSLLHSPHQASNRELFGMRLLIAGSMALTAYTARNILGNVISLVGGVCSMSTSLLLPVVFYWRLAPASEKTRVRMVGLVVMAVAGVALLMLITTLNIMQLLSKGSSSSVLSIYFSSSD